MGDHLVRKDSVEAVGEWFVSAFLRKNAVDEIDEALSVLFHADQGAKAHIMSRKPTRAQFGHGIGHGMGGGFDDTAYFRVKKDRTPSLTWSGDHGQAA